MDGVDAIGPDAVHLRMLGKDAGTLYMAIWTPGPWDPPIRKHQPETPHQAAIADTPTPAPKRRTRKPKAED